jgi:hypothetical protein
MCSNMYLWFMLTKEHKRIVVSNLEESFDQQKQLQGNVKNPGGGKKKYPQSPRLDK